MGIKEERMARCALALLFVYAAFAAMPENPEEGLGDDLALHVEHYPHTEGSNKAIYQFQIDNNNKNDRQTGPVQFTAEVSPDMEGTNAYFFRENPGHAATKEDCKVGQRSELAQEKINKKFPGAKISFPKLVRCDITHIDAFATLYVHASVPDHKELPVNEMIQASMSQKGVNRKSVQIPAIDPTQMVQF